MSQVSPRIEQLAPELEKIIATSEPIRHLADGFGGAQGPAEGPLWWKEGRYLLFSDIHNNRRMKYVPGGSASVFLEPTNRANGLTRDREGRLIACEHDSRLSSIARALHLGACTLDDLTAHGPNGPVFATPSVGWTTLLGEHGS